MGHSGFVSRINCRKRYYDKHIEKGLCGYCLKKAEEGKTLCQYHLDKQNERTKKYQAFKKKEDKNS